MGAEWWRCVESVPAQSSSPPLRTAATAHRLLRPRPTRRYPPRDLNPLRPNWTRFPDFCDAEPWRVLLRPGDMLLVPCGWFHHVYYNSTSISVTCAYQDPAYYAPEPGPVCEGAFGWL